MQAAQTLQEFVRNPKSFSRPSKSHPRIHAKNLDKKIGFKIPKIEVKLLQKYRAYDQVTDESNRKQHYKGTQTWIGLHPQVLQTPYCDIHDALELLKDFNIERVVDIGAGYGRVGIVMNALFPDSEFIGYEILSKRKEEADRIYDSLMLSNCEVRLQDVLNEDFELPKAQVYFIYDFSEKGDIEKILNQMIERRNEHNFFLITKGDRMDELLEKKYKKFWKANGFLDLGDLRIYSSITNLNDFKIGESNANR